MKWKRFKQRPSYEVSDTGLCRVVSCPNRPHRVGKLLKPSADANGYLRYNFRIEPGTKTNFLIHRLVLEVFNGPPPAYGKYHASHLDGNPRNNNLSNLQWHTPTENNRMKRIHGTSGIGEKNTNSRMKEKTVLLIISEYLSGKSSTRNLAIKFGVSASTILQIVSRRTWLHLLVTKADERKLIKIRQSKMLEPITAYNHSRRTSASR